MSPKLKRYINNPTNILVTLDHQGLLSWMSDRKLLNILGRSRLGSSFNLDKPKTFNEKLNWLKVNAHNPRYTTMADKFAVKQLLAEMDEGINCAKCYGVYDSFDEIDFQNLPNQFVLKATHDSSGATICRDKSTFNIESARQRFNRYLSHNNYRGLREWVYKNIKPRIIAEELLDDNSGRELQDYKFWCFNGEPRLMYVTNKGKIFTRISTIWNLNQSMCILDFQEGCLSMNVLLSSMK